MHDDLLCNLHFTDDDDDVDVVDHQHYTNTLGTFGGSSCENAHVDTKNFARPLDNDYFTTAAVSLPV